MSSREGLVPAAAVAALALLALGSIVGASLTRCVPTPYPQVPATPPPVSQATAIATSSAAVVATQSVRVVIRRRAARVPQEVQEPQQTAGGAGAPATRRSTPGPQAGGATPEPDDWEEELLIELSQSTTATAASTAQASASVQPVSDPYELPTHGRLGLLAAYPIGLAVDLQLLRAPLPVEVSLDLEANLEQGGLGVAVGSSVFATAGGWARWDRSALGWYVGAGVRL